MDNGLLSHHSGSVDLNPLPCAHTIMVVGVREQKRPLHREHCSVLGSHRTIEIVTALANGLQASILSSVKDVAFDVLLEADNFIA